MKQKIKKMIIAILIIIIIIGITAIFFTKRSNEELQSISSEKQLLDLYNKSDNYYDNKSVLNNIFCLPFSFIFNMGRSYYFSNSSISRASIDYDSSIIEGTSPSNVKTDSTESLSRKSTSKDYSTTNIQVENVDEADITKTDGNYIYSISEYNVVISNVTNPKEPSISAKIPGRNSSYPEDLILYNNRLVVISKESTQEKNTLVSIYDITSKENPTLVKGYQLNEPYYTSRCINNNLYVISSGYLNKNGDKIDRTYIEDGQTKEIFYNIFNH